ncbi:MAG: peptide-methionine (S)-S-oxide reductase MsrA [Candidatus Palauibacterales bacterium]|nr:peptide-methionine (S)-S-oxide reductase MsrA [Candidatus Palauibacterales bacterium]
MTPDGRTESATLAGGCFWCLDGAFRDLRGVISVESGYAGGHVPDPTYEQVCTGRTGHAEVVRITFHPDEISYRDLLEVFFSIHDPTTLNRQGADVGTQYRSAIFFHDEAQREEAEKMVAELEEEQVFEDPIVTEVTELTAWYPGEEYHQDYYRRNPGQGYCQVVVAPKLAKFRKKYAARLKD